MTSRPYCNDPEHEHESRYEAEQCIDPCPGHEWDYGDSEADPVYCIHCGADGLS